MRIPTGQVPSPLRDRFEAGRLLAAQLSEFRGTDTIVLGVPNGGVPVAAVVAEILDLPLDVAPVERVVLPSHPEVTLGSVGEHGARFVDELAAFAFDVPDRDLAALVAAADERLQRRMARLDGRGARWNLFWRVALVIDDGLATGATARAACQSAGSFDPARVVLAVPVARQSSLQAVRAVDQTVALALPSPFIAIARHYDDFAAVDDEVVDRLLDYAAGRIDETRHLGNVGARRRR